MINLKKIVICGMLGVAVFLNSACSEDSSVDYTEYYPRRDAQNEFCAMLLNKQRTDSARTYFNHKVMSLAEPVTSNNKDTEFRNYTYFHVVQACDTADLIKRNRLYHPYYNSTCKVHYTLFKTDSVMAKFSRAEAMVGKDYLHDKVVMDAIFMDVSKREDPKLAAMKADTLESYQVQYQSFTPGGVIKGWGDVLQNMYEGDSYVICLPWYLAYGQGGSGNIPPYSNLFFRLQLVEITNLGQNVDRVEKE